MSNKEIKISTLINEHYREYCHYVIKSRALPLLSDGLKPVERRSLYTSKKIAKDWCKVAKLAGATLAIHPHGNVSVEDCITGMTQQFAGANNIPYFDGKGTFGSRISGPGKGIASARYVAVKLSESFFKYFDVDSDLIELQTSYDDTEKEPITFLPIVPAVLLNPTAGIAVGFACNILPRNINEIKKQQVNYLTGKKVQSLKPYYEGFKGEIFKNAKDEWASKGLFTIKDKQLIITELPIGLDREKFVDLLDRLEDPLDQKERIVNKYIDACREEFHFTISLTRSLSNEEVIDKFKLVSNLSENITLIGFDNSVKERLTDVEVIEQFTEWRFGFYLKRFQKLEEQVSEELKFKLALLNVIESGIFKKFPNQSRKEIIESLKKENIENSHINKIMAIPIYRFGKDEVEKLKDSIKELKANQLDYLKLIKSEDLRREYFVKELKA